MKRERIETALREQLTEISHRAYWRGLVRGSGGNISCRLDDGQMLITPSGVSLGDTAPDNIVKVDLETGEWEHNGAYIPSKETGFHSAIYRARPEINAIVHCHPPHATAYAVRGLDIPAVTDAAFKQPPMPHVSFSPSGSMELAQKVAQAVRQPGELRVVLLEQHGIIAVGSDLVQALTWADLAEEMAQIAFVSATIHAPAPQPEGGNSEAT